MCMEDIRIGRKTESTIYPATTPLVGVTPVAPQNPHRIRITFSFSAAGGVTFWPGTKGSPSPVAFQVPTTLFPVTFRIEDIGPIICFPWFANDGGAGATLTVVDCSLPDN